MLLNEERVGIDREAHPHIGAGAPSLRDFHGSTDAPRLNRHKQTGSAFSDQDRNLYQSGSPPPLIRPTTPIGRLPEQAQDAAQGRAGSKRLPGLPFAWPPSRHPDRLLAALLAPRIKIVYMIHAASSPSRAPESLPSIKTPANIRRCYLHEHPSYGLGASAQQPGRGEPEPPSKTRAPTDTSNTTDAPPVFGSRPSTAAEAELPLPP